MCPGAGDEIRALFLAFILKGRSHLVELQEFWAKILETLVNPGFRTEDL
jgi:hypothetical protein